MIRSESKTCFDLCDFETVMDMNAHELTHTDTSTNTEKSSAVPNNPQIP